MKEMIIITPSPTADSRTCDPTTVDQETLRRSSVRHISDVRNGIKVIIDMLTHASGNHDRTKLDYEDRFYRDFINGFKRPQHWYPLHLKAERHHLDNPEGVRDDVNLVDVIEHLIDNVMSGIARTGGYSPSVLPGWLLQKAYNNTAKMLVDYIVLDETEGDE